MEASELFENMVKDLGVSILDYVEMYNIEYFIKRWRLELWELAFFHEFKPKEGTSKVKPKTNNMELRRLLSVLFISKHLNLSPILSKHMRFFHSELLHHYIPIKKNLIFLQLLFSCLIGPTCYLDSCYFFQDMVWSEGQNHHVSQGFTKRISLFNTLNWYLDYPCEYWQQLEIKQEMKHSRFMKWNNCIN
jgi:hypothetical protein